MKERGLLLLNIGLFIFATVILVTLQTSLWYQLFGYFPPPALWIPGVIYLSLNRSTIEASLVSYAMAICMTPMTTMMPSLFLLSCLLLVVGTQLFKQRIFWNRSSYFMMVSGLGALFFHLAYLLLSWTFEDNALNDPELSSWLIEALLTPLAAPPLYQLFSWFDRLTNRRQAVESGVEAI